MALSDRKDQDTNTGFVKILKDLERLDTENATAVGAYFRQFGQHIEKITEELAIEKFKKKFEAKYGKAFNQPPERFTYHFNETLLKKINDIGPLINDLLTEDDINKTPEDFARLEEFKKYCKDQKIDFDQIREILAYADVVKSIDAFDVNNKLFSELEAKKMAIEPIHRKQIHKLVNTNNAISNSQLSRLEVVVQDCYKKELKNKIASNPELFTALMDELFKEVDNLVKLKNDENQYEIKGEVGAKLLFMADLFTAKEVESVDKKSIDKERSRLLEYFKSNNIPLSQDRLNRINGVGKIINNSGNTTAITKTLCLDPHPQNSFVDVDPREKQSSEEVLLAQQKEFVKQALNEAKKKCKENDGAYSAIESFESGLNDIKSGKDLEQKLINLEHKIPIMKRRIIKISEIRRDIMPIALKNTKREEIIRKVTNDIDKDQRYDVTSESARAKINAKKRAVELINNIKTIGDLKSVAKTCIPSDGDAHYSIREIIRKESKRKLPPKQKDPGELSWGDRIAKRMGLK